MIFSAKGHFMIKLFGYAMDIGEQMLISGAEVHRVEESISRMCYAFGAIRVDVFIITTSMVVTVHTSDNKTYTQTRRVTSTNTNYEKVHHLNQLSREICEKHLTADEIESKLNDAVQRCSAALSSGNNKRKSKKPYISRAFGTQNEFSIPF